MNPIKTNSAEIRWFLPDNQQFNQILRWFRLNDQLSVYDTDNPGPNMIRNALVVKEPERSDQYLLLPNCQTVGVKQRQGKLEVKALVGGPQLLSLNQTAGYVDQWSRWSFDPSDAIANQLERELSQTGLWRQVVKNRWIQKYSYDSDSLVAVPPLDETKRPNFGCNIELTSIGVKTNTGPWFSFGFEAFGSNNRTMAILYETVELFFSTHDLAPVSLQARDSQSYPAWLSMLR